MYTYMPCLHQCASHISHHDIRALSVFLQTIVFYQLSVKPCGDKTGFISKWKWLELHHVTEDISGMLLSKNDL